MPADKPSASSRSVPKRPGQKRTRNGCANCRARRHKCDEVKPVCSRCLRTNVECLWPLEVPKQALFQPYNPDKTGSTSFVPPTASPSTSNGSPQPPPLHRAPSSVPGLGHRHSSAPLVAPLPPAPVSRASIPSPEELDVILHKNPTPFLEVCFPDQQERFIAHSLLSLMNHLGPVDPTFPPTPSSSAPQTFTHVFPMLELHQFLTSRTTGGSIANDALSYAFLAVGAVQISYLHHQSAIRYASDGNPAAAQSSGDNNRKYTTLSSSLFNAAVATIRAATSLIEVKGGQRDEVVLDTLNAAASFALLSRTLGGGSGYQEALSLAKTLVGIGGGPKRMLEGAKASSDPNRLRRVRTALEHLVGYDIFSCLSSARSPDVSFPSELPERSEPLASWYFDYAPPSNTLRYIQSPDWETVESLMGISRGMMELLNRVSTLYWVSRPNPHRDGPANVEEVWIQQANLLLGEIDRWGEAYKDARMAVHGSRIDFGNQIYVQFFKIIIFLDVFRYRIWNPDVQWAAKEIVRLVHECKRLNGPYLMGWMMPLVFAGSTFWRPEDRDDVRRALQYYRPICCFTIEAAWGMLEKVWERRDAGDESTNWRSVASEGGGMVLV